MFLRLHVPAALLALVAFGGNARAHDLSLSLQHRSGGTVFGVSDRDRLLRCVLHAGSLPSARGDLGGRRGAPSGSPRASRCIWISPVYRTWYDHCGHAHSVLVRPGYWQNTCEPGHWEVRQRKVWIPNYRPLLARLLPTLNPGRRSWMGLRRVSPRSSVLRGSVHVPARDSR
jgi:hypothetical protein